MIRNSKLFTLNSHDSLTKGSKFTVKVDLPSHHNFNRVCLVQASFPKSWYTIQTGQNVVTLSEGPAEAKVSVMPANYNRKSLAIVMSKALTESSPNGYTYSVTYPNSNVTGDDGKYTFSVSHLDPPEAPPEEIKIIVPEMKVSNMFEVLGFEPGSTNIFTQSDNAQIVKSTNVIKVQAEDVIRIHCNVCDNGGDNILLELYGNSNPMFSNVTWNCPYIPAYSKPLVNKSTNSLEFYLTNEDNQELILNGLNYCVQLLIYEEFMPT